MAPAPITEILWKEDMAVSPDEEWSPGHERLPGSPSVKTDIIIKGRDAFGQAKVRLHLRDGLIEVRREKTGRGSGAAGLSVKHQKGDSPLVTVSALLTASAICGEDGTGRHSPVVPGAAVFFPPAVFSVSSFKGGPSFGRMSLEHREPAVQTGAPSPSVTPDEEELVQTHSLKNLHGISGRISLCHAREGLRQPGAPGPVKRHPQGEDYRQKGAVCQGEGERKRKTPSGKKVDERIQENARGRRFRRENRRRVPWCTETAQEKDGFFRMIASFHRVTCRWSDSACLQAEPCP
jgi:hypothetical protein